MQFEFIINFKTAAALAFAMPPTAPTGRRGARIAVLLRCIGPLLALFGHAKQPS
jgi:hypothetical protein